MPEQSWIKNLEDGRSVRFTHRMLPEGEAFLTAQIEGKVAVHSVLVAIVRDPLSSGDVESYFQSELSKE